MIVKLLTEHDLEFLSLKGGCIGSSESTLVKMPHCWKSHVTAHLGLAAYEPFKIHMEHPNNIVPSWMEHSNRQEMFCLLDLMLYVPVNNFSIML